MKKFLLPLLPFLLFLIALILIIYGLKGIIEKKTLPVYLWIVLLFWSVIFFFVWREIFWKNRYEWKLKKIFFKLNLRQAQKLDRKAKQKQKEKKKKEVRKEKELITLAQQRLKK